MDNPRDQGAHVSELRQRASKAGENVIRLQAELKAERELRDDALVELYDNRRAAGVTVDGIAEIGRVSRSTLLGIVAAH